MRVKLPLKFHLICMLALGLNGVALAAPFAIQSFRADESVLRIPPGGPGASSITQAQFAEVTAGVIASNAGPISASGRLLALDLDWENPYIGAGSTLYDGVFKLMLWGGFARIPGMTPDVLAFVACHEIGHLIGGAPRQTYPGTEWSSAEGQSDYFAASQCLKRYFKGEDHQSALRGKAVDPVLSLRCAEAFADVSDSALCQRIGMIGLDFVRVVDWMTGASSEVSYSRPDPSSVQVTLHDRYPSPQCRLDTIVAGALCTESTRDPLRSCESGVGARPACWLKTP